MERYHNLTEMLVKRGDNVHSPDELHGYAEKLLRGDD